MQIFPAIDIRDGKCVRLRQGDFEQETIFGADPVVMARRWVERGAQFLHLVDLDGAREGRPTNQAAIQGIVQSCGVPCQLGGGLRREDHIAEVLAWGVNRVIVGTSAIADPAWLDSMCRRFPQQIVLGLDAKNGRLSTHGWRETSEQTALTAAQRVNALHLAAIVYTDIAMDGMLAGPNVEATAQLARATGIPIIASGGVTSTADIERLAARGIHGCIIGRALYEGTLRLEDALQAARKEVVSPPQ